MSTTSGGTTSTARRRRVPTSAELAVWRAHVETFDVVRSRIEARLQRDAQLSSGDYKVLLALSEAEGNSLRPSELAALIEWERSRLSGHLGRMEKRGLVRREPCPDDARGAFVVLTETGARAFHGSTSAHLQAVKETFVDAFSDEQLRALGEATAALRAHLGLPPQAGG
ncbi:MarR family winged helix-turn-helix transcriptional regulator [Kineococcus sp. SYSU DK003]|uniref:MarR family winged helix-turn-helix transcriptional regulator n=1 Tax=Kineococcus sp. SYSU DK003 TaxID=3383124 RepID=UPI003D7E01A0